MTVLLVAVAAYTIVGGMLSVLVTDYLQFIVMSVGMLAVTFLMLAIIPWSTTGRSRASRPVMAPADSIRFVNVELGWPFVIFKLC